MNKEPNYERYNLRQLHEALEYIDKTKYRDRYDKIQKYIEIKSTNPSEQDLQFLSDLEQKEKEQQKTKRNWKHPITKGIYMLGIGITGLYSGVIYLENGKISYIDNPDLFVIYLLIFLGVGFHLVIEGLSKWEKYKNDN
jgi:hypothetical protein